jgi:hypothetical protein
MHVDQSEINRQPLVDAAAVEDPWPRQIAVVGQAPLVGK